MVCCPAAVRPANRALLPPGRAPGSRILWRLLSLLGSNLLTRWVWSPLVQVLGLVLVPAFFPRWPLAGTWPTFRLHPRLPFHPAKPRFRSFAAVFRQGEPNRGLPARGPRGGAAIPPLLRPPRRRPGFPANPGLHRRQPLILVRLLERRASLLQPLQPPSPLPVRPLILVHRSWRWIRFLLQYAPRRACRWLDPIRATNRGLDRCSAPRM